MKLPKKEKLEGAVFDSILLTDTQEKKGEMASTAASNPRRQQQSGPNAAAPVAAVASPLARARDGSVGTLAAGPSTNRVNLPQQPPPSGGGGGGGGTIFSLTHEDIVQRRHRLFHPHHEADSPNTKRQVWAGTEDGVVEPRWNVLLQQELYGPELRVKEELARKYATMAGLAALSLPPPPPQGPLMEVIASQQPPAAGGNGEEGPVTVAAGPQQQEGVGGEGRQNSQKSAVAENSTAARDTSKSTGSPSSKPTPTASAATSPPNSNNKKKMSHQPVASPSKQEGGMSPARTAEKKTMRAPAGHTPSPRRTK